MEYIPKRSNHFGTVLSFLFLVFSLGSLALSAIIVEYKYLFFLITASFVLLSIFILIRYTINVYKYTIEQHEKNEFTNNNLSLDFVVWKRFSDNPYREEARLGLDNFIDIKIKGKDNLKDIKMSVYNYCPSFAPKKMSQLIFNDGDKLIAVNVELNDELIEKFYELKKL